MLVQGDMCFKKAKDTIAKLKCIVRNLSETAISHNMPFQENDKFIHKSVKPKL